MCNLYLWTLRVFADQLCVCLQSSGSSSSTLASAAVTFTTYMANKNKKTAAVTATKGVKRKAHTPTVVREQHSFEAVRLAAIDLRTV